MRRQMIWSGVGCALIGAVLLLVAMRSRVQSVDAASAPDAPPVSRAVPVALASQVIITGLNNPLYLTSPPGDFQRLFILEQNTRQIRIIKNGALLPTPFLTVTAADAMGFERGLLGLAFHPDYANNGRFFVNYTAGLVTASRTEIAEYTVSASNPDIANPTGDVIMTYSQPFENHNGGWLSFGPDGMLYIASGDGGSANDPNNNAQQTTNQKLGKMLRIDVNGDDFPADPLRDYRIPPSNPFVGAPGDDEIWSYGLRNPWRPSFDRATGDLWIADVGQDMREEINFQPASSTGGENYGWRCLEGTLCTGSTGCSCADTSLVSPIHEYTHAAGKCSITGGYVYRGCAIPALQGSYFFADYCTGQVWSLRYDGVNITELVERTAELAAPGGFYTSFGQDAFGELYLISQAGVISKIVAADPGACADCNANGQCDPCDILAGISADANGNGVPDSCEAPLCPWDLNADGVVGAPDLAVLIGSWSLPYGAADLANLVGAWGPCL